MTLISRPDRPVRPRHAASLVIYERKEDDIYVLMGKRAKTHRFLPNVYVFPGGRVDKADADLEPLAPLSPEIEKMLSRPADMAHAVAAAAVRETHEETGLIIGDVKADKVIPDLSNLDYVARAITPPISPIRFNTRFLSIDARHVSGTLGGSGELIDLRWIPLAEALTMPLVDVTEFVLGEMERKLTSAARMASSGTTPVPLFTYFRGKALIRTSGHE